MHLCMDVRQTLVKEIFFMIEINLDFSVCQYSGPLGEDISIRTCAIVALKLKAKCSRKEFSKTFGSSTGPKTLVNQKLMWRIRAWWSVEYSLQENAWNPSVICLLNAQMLHIYQYWRCLHAHQKAWYPLETTEFYSNPWWIENTLWYVSDLLIQKRITFFQYLFEVKPLLNSNNCFNYDNKLNACWWVHFWVVAWQALTRIEVKLYFI